MRKATTGEREMTDSRQTKPQSSEKNRQDVRPDTGRGQETSPGRPLRSNEEIEENRLRDRQNLIAGIIILVLGVLIYFMFVEFDNLQRIERCIEARLKKCEILEIAPSAQ
jgi:hypothetical protein